MSSGASGAGQARFLETISAPEILACRGARHSLLPSRHSALQGYQPFTPGQPSLLSRQASGQAWWCWPNLFTDKLSLFLRGALLAPHQEPDLRGPYLPLPHAPHSRSCPNAPCPRQGGAVPWWMDLVLSVPSPTGQSSSCRQCTCPLGQVRWIPHVLTAALVKFRAF